MSNEWGDVETKAGGEYKDFEIPPSGAIPARVCAMIDVGTHDARTLKGEVYERRTLILGFELGEKTKTGEPFYMARNYTLSLDVQSNLFAIVKALNGEPKIGDKLNADWLANKPCLLQVSHETKTKKGKDRTYANIDSVGQPPRGTPTPGGSCILWRVGSSSPLPDTSHLPPLWHEATGKMLTVGQWAAASKEAHNGAKVVMAVPAGATKAEPMTQVEADAIASEVPF